MAYEAVLNRADIFRVYLEEQYEGVYVFVYEHENSPGPEMDYLQDDVEMAMGFCEEDFGIPRSAWREIESENLMTPE